MFLFPTVHTSPEIRSNVLGSIGTIVQWTKGFEGHFKTAQCSESYTKRMFGAEENTITH